MKDRFSDTSKDIFDSRDFEEIQNAIGQLEEIISRNRRGRTRREEDASSNSTHPSTSTLVEDDVKRPTHSSGKDISKRDHGLETSHGAKPININNNNIIIPPQSNSKSNGIGKKTGSQASIPNAIVTPISPKDSSDKSKTPFGKTEKKPIILIATPLPKSSSTSANHVKPSTSSPSGSGYTTYQLKKSSSSSAALSSGSTPATTTLTTTAILHTHVPDSDDDTTGDCNKTARESASGADSSNYIRPAVIIKANGISKKSMTASSSSNHHASQPKVINYI